MNKPISEQALQDKIDALSDEITPERDLWSGIDHAIEHQCQSAIHKTEKTNFKPYALAASVMLAVLVTVFNYSSLNTPQQKLTGLEAIEQQFDQQKNAMLVSFGEPKIDKLPSDIQAQFNELKAARLSLVEALKSDPNNPNLLNLLKYTQRQELSLIEQLYSPKWLTI
jgi:negative regulator of sigma E activity